MCQRLEVFGDVRDLRKPQAGSELRPCGLVVPLLRGLLRWLRRRSVEGVGRPGEASARPLEWDRNDHGCCSEQECPRDRLRCQSCAGRGFPGQAAGRGSLGEYRPAWRRCSSACHHGRTGRRSASVLVHRSGGRFNSRSPTERAPAACRQRYRLSAGLSDFVRDEHARGLLLYGPVPDRAGTDRTARRDQSDLVETG